MVRLGDPEYSNRRAFATDGQGYLGPRSDEGEYMMRGVNRPTPWQHSPQDRSGVRSAGHAGGVAVRAAAIVAAMGLSALAAAAPAAAHVATGQSATAVSVAQSDPMAFGLGPAGLFWLLAGVLALVLGLVLATRRVRGPADGGVPAGRSAGFGSTVTSESTSRSTSTSHDRAGGAEK